MNLKKVMLACLLGCPAINSALAFEVCKTYEYEELKTFSNDELRTMYADYKSVHDRIGTTLPTTPREVQEDFNDQQKCSGEMTRINRLLDSREKAQAKPKSSGKKKSST